MAVLDIVKYGDPILRKTCRQVTDFSNLDDLVDDMFDTMYEADGIGLAANQVGVNLNLFVIDISHTEEADEPATFINGKIVESSGECLFDEGCLSIPEVTLEIKRPETIVFKYQDLDEVWHEETFTGLFARAIQHEMDHLSGKMIVDRVPEIATMAYKSHLKDLAKKSKTRSKSIQEKFVF